MILEEVIAGSRDRSALIEEVKGYLSERYVELYQRHQSGASGGSIVKELTALIDEVIDAAFEFSLSEYKEQDRHLLEQTSSLVALGGYGRGELSPYSDIDLMLLYREKAQGAVERFSKEFFRLLWDLKFTIGHSIRTIGMCLDLGKRDMTIRTSLMESRYLKGSKKLFDEFHAHYFPKVVKKNIRSYITAKINERDEGYARYGSTVYLLEPDIKRSVGGLRDIHYLQWIAAARYGINDLETLFHRGYLTKNEYLGLIRGRESLWRIRNEMHFYAHKASDLLSFDEQVRLTRVFNYQDKGHFLGVERFMQDYYFHLTRIHNISRRFIERSLPDSLFKRATDLFISRKINEIFSTNGRELFVRLKGKDHFSSNPRNIFMAFYYAKVYGLKLPVETLDLIQQAVDILEKPLRPPGGMEILKGILSSPGGIAVNLRLMHSFRLLEEVLPELKPVDCLMQFNEYHKYTVDEHCIRAVEMAERLMHRTGLISDCYREIRRKDLLHLALLLHDLGKGKAGDHSVEGEQITLDVAERLGYHEEEKRLLAFLARNHLMMSNTSFRRDLSDEKVLLIFSRHVATPELLKMLFVLTYADISAIGPEAWTAWKESLLTDLYSKALEELTGARAVVSKDEKLQKIKEGIVQSLSGVYPVTWLEDQLEVFAHRYLLATPPDKIIQHIHGINQLPQGGVFVERQDDPEKGISEFTVYTSDAPGIFFKIAGVFAARNLNILSAQVYTHRNGVVVDTFQLMDIYRIYQSYPEELDAIKGDIEDVLTGKRNVEELFDQRTRIFGRRSFHMLIPATQVEVDNDTSDEFTIIDVFAQDKQGLLYVITRALYDLGLSIYYSKIATRLDQIVDVFYVKTISGEKITEPAKINQIKETLSARIDDFCREA